jgi:hypothetical protein
MVGTTDGADLLFAESVYRRGSVRLLVLGEGVLGQM